MVRATEGIGVRIVTAMAKAGKSANSLSKEIAARYGDVGPKRQAIADYISGKTSPSIDALSRLAWALGVSPSWLMGGGDALAPAPSPIVAAWRVPTERGVDIYEVVCANGTVWRFRGEYWSDAADEMIPASGWFRVIPPLTEMNTNAEEV